MVEIIHYETANKNKTIGFADIRVPILKPTVLIIRRVGHIQSGDRRWFSLASFSRENKDRTPSYLKYFEFETATYNNQLLESLNEKVKDYCKKHGISASEPMDFGAFPEGNSNELPF